jgi:hypothetical protein
MPKRRGRYRRPGFAGLKISLEERLVYRRITSRQRPKRRPGFARFSLEERLVPEDFFKTLAKILKTEAKQEAWLFSVG